MSHLSEFATYQSLKFESISVDAFTLGNEQYVVFAQPFAGTCSFLEWDHVEMTFRTYDTIESEFCFLFFLKSIQECVNILTWNDLNV